MKSRRAHHQHRHHLRGHGYFRRLGPGIVTGAADDDPSGIGTYSQVGSAFGFGMLWTAVISFPLAAAVQETAARLGLASGKGLSQLIRERFPRPVLYAAVLLVVAANTFNIGADLGAMTAATRLVIPLPFPILIVAFAVLIAFFEVVVPYHRYVKILRWLVLSLGAYVVVLFSVAIDWGSVARSTFLPDLHLGRGEIAALIAILGTTISPYLFFWQAAEELEEQHEHPHSGEVKRDEVVAMRVDVIAGMFSAVVVMFAIMTASSATLHARGITDVQTADQAARALRPIAGSLAGTIFALGIVGTGLLAIPTLAGSTAYASAEAFHWNEGLFRRFREAPGFYGVIIAAMGTGLALNAFGVNPIKALYFAAILNGLAAPPLILLMLILSNSHAVGRQQGGRVSDALVGLAFLVMTASAIAFLIVR